MNDIQDNERELANENFWKNINSRSDYIKYEFGQSVEILENYLPELKNNYVKLSPAFEAGELKNGIVRIINNPDDWEKIAQKLIHILSEVSTDLVAVVNDDYGVWDKIQQWVSWAWGAIIGDFNKSPTFSQTIVAGLISIIPVADQVSDIRDLIANVLILTDENERENTENWINLALTAFGLIPTVGSIIKTLIKVIRHKDLTDLKVLENIMETCETHLRKIGAEDNIPWKDNPIHWLQTRPWQELADKAKTSIQEYLKNFSEELQDFENFLSDPKYLEQDRKLYQLAQTIEHTIAKNINQYIDNIAFEVSSKVDELLHTPYTMAMVGNGGKSKHDIHIGGNTALDTPTKATHQQPSQKIFTGVMRPKKVGCFNRVDTPHARKQAEINIKNDHPPGSKDLTVDEYLNQETDRQLKLQEDGINSLTVAEYEQSRDDFRANGRGNGLDQKQTREEYEQYLLELYNERYKKSGMSKTEAKQKSQETTNNIMGTLAALHNPDQVAGGGRSKVPMEMGLKSVNSSIGTFWTKKPNDDTMNESDRHLTRIDSIDKAVADLPADTDKTQTRMNVKLQRCK